MLRGGRAAQQQVVGAWLQAQAAADAGSAAAFVAALCAVTHQLGERALAEAEPGVIFAGRLGSYRYYNMDQVVGQALAIHRRLDARLPGLAATLAGE